MLLVIFISTERLKILLQSQQFFNDYTKELHHDWTGVESNLVLFQDALMLSKKRLKENPHHDWTDVEINSVLLILFEDRTQRDE